MDRPTADALPQRLYWNPMRRLYHSVCAASAATQQELKEQLDRNEEWLLGCLSDFKGPDDASRRAVTEGRALTFKVGRVGVEQRLRKATEQLSQLLDLNEVQCHMLLKRWVKEAGREDLLQTAPPQGQATLPADAVDEVMSYYYEERLYLLKTVQFLLLHGRPLQVDAVSMVCQEMANRLIAAGLEDTVFDSLALNLKGSATSAATAMPTSAAAAGGTTALAAAGTTAAPAIIPPADFAQRAQLQALAERSELQGALLLMYSQHEVACGPERLVSLLQLLGSAMFRSPGSAAAAKGVIRGGQEDAMKQGLANAEALAAVLVLAAMQPALLLSLLASPQLPSCDSVPLASKARSIDSELRGWAVSPAAVPVLFGWSAYVRLLACYRLLDDHGSQEHQAHALEGGGFAAMACLLALPSFAAEELQGQAHRSVMLQALCMVATAFQLSPMALPAQLTTELVGLVCALVEGSPALTAQIWDDSLLLAAPLRVLRDELALLFPAFSAPFLALVTGLAQGRAGAAAAYAYLSGEVLPTLLHDASERALVGVEGGEGMVLEEALPWSGAPDVQGVVLPEGCQGRVLALPEFAKEQHGDTKVLVQWDLMAEHGTGQVFCLARAAHCLVCLNSSSRPLQEQLASQEFKDLCAILRLLRQLLSGEPLLARPLLDTSIAYKGYEARLDWLAVVSSALTLLPRLGAGDALQAVADSLHVARGLALYQPARVMEQLSATPLFEGCRDGGELPRVAIEEAAGVPSEQLAGPLQGQLPALQAVQSELEAPSASYPATSAVLSLIIQLLGQQYTQGPMTCLVMWAVHKGLGALPRLTFRSPAERWQLVGQLLEVIRASLTAGAVSEHGAAPKAAGPPSGVRITALAASVIHQLASNGHGYLPSVLPPSADTQVALVERGAGGLEVTACLEATEQLLMLVPELVGALAHFPTTAPLQQWWFATMPGGATPAHIIATYAAYPYGQRIPTLALKALQAFALSLSGPVGSGRPRISECFSSVLLGSAPVRAGLLLPFRPEYASSYPEWFAAAAELFEAGARYQPELLDALCFPSSLQLPLSQNSSTDNGASTSTDPVPTSALTAARDTKKKSAANAWSALDGLWALLQRAAQLQQEQPMLLAHVMHALSALWECQGSAPSAVELLRSQTGFWDALKACTPDSASSQDVVSLQTEEQQETSAWVADAQACTLHMLLLELLTPPQQQQQQQQLLLGAAPPATAAERGSEAGSPKRAHRSSDRDASQRAAGASTAGHASSSSPRQLLDAWGPARVSQQLMSVRPRLDQALLSQLLGLTQATYLQLGASALRGCWGDVAHDLIGPAPEVRQELRHLAAMYQEGRVSLEALGTACQELAAAGAAGAAVGGGPGSPGHALAQALIAQPLGQVLLGHAGTGPGAVAFGATEYGRSFLYDSLRLGQLLGPFVMGDLQAAEALAATMETVGTMASAAHAQLSVLQATCSLLSALPRDAAAKEQLRRPEMANAMLSNVVSAVVTAVEDYEAIAAAPCIRLLTVPWGLPFLGRAAAEAVALTATALLQATRMWKAVHGHTAAANALSSGPVPASRQQGRGKSVLGPAGRAAGAGGMLDAARERLVCVMDACGRCAGLLSGWLRSEGQEALAASGGGDVGLAPNSSSEAGSAHRSWEVAEKLATSLLLLLQEAPVAMDIVGDAAAPEAGGFGNDQAGSVRKSRAALQLALQELLPVLCGAAASEDGGAGVNAAGHAQRAALLQLLIEVLARQLPSDTWMPVVKDTLALPRVLASAAARLQHTRLKQQQEQQEQQCEALNVADTCVLELALTVAQVQEGALLLAQQDIMSVCIGYARQLLASDRSALSPEAASDSDTAGAYAAPATAGAATVWAPAHQQWCVLLELVGAVLRGAGAALGMARSAVDFVVAAEARLLLALAPPDGSESQPLTLASLVELGRALFVACQVAKHRGEWLLARPASLGAFRLSAAAVLAFAAQPSRQQDGAVMVMACGPQSAFERRLARLPSGLAGTEGWLGVARRGAGDAPGAPGTSPRGAAGQGASEYCARLAEAMYTATQHAVEFLAATSPQVQRGEAAALGAAWPTRSTLQVLQQQCVAVASSLVHAAQSTERSRRLAWLVLHIAGGLTVFMDALGATPAQDMRDKVLAIRRALGSPAKPAAGRHIS